MSICFYDKAKCDEEKIILVDFTNETGKKDKALCCKNCLVNKVKSKITFYTDEKETKRKKCPSCDIDFLEIMQTSKIGCPLCYSFFYDELKILIKNCQNQKEENLGKIPLGIHHKSALVSCILKDLEKEDQNSEIVLELMKYFKNF